MHINGRHILSIFAVLLLFMASGNAQITDPILLKSIKEQRDSIRALKDSLRNLQYEQLNKDANLPAVNVRQRTRLKEERKQIADSLLALKLKRRQDSIAATQREKRQRDSLKQLVKSIEDTSKVKDTISNKPTPQPTSPAEQEEAAPLNEQNNLEVPTRQDTEPVLIPDTAEPSVLENKTEPSLEENAVVTEMPQDSTKTDSIKNTSTLLTDLVTYKAKDYMRLSRRDKKMYLYNEAEVFYNDMQITAGLIIIDNEKNEVYAYGIKDSLGDYSQAPVFTQAQSVVKPDSIRFNFETEKALVYNSKTEEGGFKVKGEVTKRQNDSVYYMKNVRFTTSQDVDDPDYYFYARRVKFVPDKKIVTGLVNMFIVDVPTPLGLPFGYFPLTEERASGFIIPSYGEDQRRGFSLQNGGYYFAINDYVDLTATGSYFTNGSYTLQLRSTYANRYQYRGNVNFRYERQLNSERGFPDFSESTLYNLQWSHQQDPKASPNSQFNASVNLGSQEYFQQSINQQNLGSNLNNTLSSSVSYNKLFPGNPEFNLNITASHSQNSRTGDVNLTLPTLTASMGRIFPFKPRSGVSKGLLENINLSYNLSAQNRYNTTTEEFFTAEMFKDGVLGAQHTIPVNTNVKLLNYFNLSAGGTYQENWVFRTFEQRYDEVREEVVRDTIRGFDSNRNFNLSTGLSTSVYGTFNFGKDKKIQAIRHVINPEISFNINPGFPQFYDEYIIPATAPGEEDEVVSYSRFEGTLFGTPRLDTQSSIRLRINNTLEAKVRDKDTTKLEAKKIKLLNNLSFNTSYNLTADSLKLSPVGIAGAIPLFDNKLTINFRGALDIYALNNNNQRIDKLNINNGGSLFRLTSGNISFGYNFSSDTFSKKVEDPNRRDNQTFRNGGRQDDLFGKPIDTDGDVYDEKEEETSEGIKRFVNKIPWTLNLQYSLNYQNNARQNEITSQAISVRSDLELSPKWTVGGSTSFNVQDQSFSNTSFNFQRDLGSFRMSFAWRPFSAFSSWNFFIGIKSSLLQDLKYDQQRRPDQNL